MSRLLLLLAVFLTGGTALAYEIAWTRGLTLVLGSTATTTAVVLAVFVGALGFGARWGGPRADRTGRPLLFYGLLELVAAGWAVIALFLAGFLLTPYAAVAGALPGSLRFALRVLIAALVVAPGAFALGATLPALVRHWVGVRIGATARGTAWVYGVNTLGAVAGAFLSGFYGIEAFGVVGWLALTAGVAAAVGLVASLVGRRLAPLARVEAVPTPTTWAERMPLAPALATALACGALGLGIEVAGFRTLVFFVEGFTATFAAMLGVFILGLGLGSLLVGPWAVKTARPDVRLATLLLLLSGAVGLSLWVLLPGLEAFVQDVRADAYVGTTGEAGIQAGLRWTALAGSAALLLLPALILGATFPLCVRWAELAGLRPGAAVGRVYLANSIGTILGPLLVGFLVIPTAGISDTWRALGIAAFLAAAATALYRRGARRWGPKALIVWTLPLIALLLPAVFGGGGLSSGIVEVSHVMQGRPDRRLLDARADAITTASVVDTGDGERILYTDDFAAAATGRHYRYMRMLGHLPVLLADRPENAMVIAFGTGTTAGAVAAHEDVKRIEVVEVSPAVLAFAPLFAEANRHVLDDPRTTVIADDGRNTLLLHDGDLDVITLEPLMPYSPAGLPFYTREFYELCRDRLRDGGVVCQWIPVHAMSASLYAAFARTFFEVFPDGSLFFYEQSSALVARKGGGSVAPELLRARLGAAAEDLEAAGLADEDAFRAAYVASGRRVLAAEAPGPFAERTVKDFDPYPEFHPTPRASLNTSYLADTLRWLSTLVVDEDTFEGRDASATRTMLLGRTHDAEAVWLGVERRYARGNRARQAALLEAEIEAWAAAHALYGQSLDAVAGQPVVRWRAQRAGRRIASLRAQALVAKSLQLRASGLDGEAQATLASAADLLAEALRGEVIDPLAAERASVLAAWVGIQLRRGHCGEAERRLADEIGFFPRSEDREQLERLLDAVGAWHASGIVPRDPALAPTFQGLPACRGDTSALAAGLTERYVAALTAGDARRLRLAADALLHDAVRQQLEGDVLRAVLSAPRPTTAEAQAVQLVLTAMLRDALAGDHERLGQLLSSSSPPALEAALLLEAGRRRRLRHYPEVARSAAASPSAEVRRAVAEAVGGDGDAGLLVLLPDLLIDPDREVRLAALVPLVRRLPHVMSAYDPDASPAKRAEAADAVRAALPKR